MSFTAQMMGTGERVDAPTNISEIARLNKALRANARMTAQMAKSATIGYQTPAGTTGGDAGSYSPLVPQSIDDMLTTLSYTAEDLTLWKRMPRGEATQPLHEYAVRVRHGHDLPIFMNEGGVVGTNVSRDRREYARVKYMAEKRQVTDVATTVGLLGVNSSALADQTEAATVHLLERIERAAFHGNASLDDRGFDGILKQIEDNAPRNVKDLDGASPTLDMLQECLFEYGAEPYFGRFDCLYVEPKIFGELAQQPTSKGRYVTTDVNGNTTITHGTAALQIMGRHGPVPIISAPFLNNRRFVPLNDAGNAVRNTAVGDSTDQPTTPQLDVAIAAGFHGSSKFEAADEGTYTYYVEAVGEKGLSAIFTTPPVVVSADDRVSFTIKGDALAKEPIYYRIYRTKVDGDYTSATMLFEQAYTSGQDTQVFDTNSVKPGSSSILGIKHDKSIFEWVKMMDLIRRPLAQTATAVPFLVMMFGVPIVKAPSKAFVIKNCTPNSSFGA